MKIGKEAEFIWIEWGERGMAEFYAFAHFFVRLNSFFFCILNETGGDTVEEKDVERYIEIELDRRR